MNASVYSSLFNYSPEKFDLPGALKNWSKYANEIVIGTFEDQREEVEKTLHFNKIYLWSRDFNFSAKLKVVSCPETSLDDPLFDGKLKNAALQACSNELVIQQDMDERIGGDVKRWEELGELLKTYPAPFACMIPVIDLYKDFEHYRNVNAKWYLSLKKDLYRGPVNFAKKGDNLIDITKSDSTEAIDKDGNLVPYFYDNRFCDTSHKEGYRFHVSMPHVCHLGYLDLDKRVENNKFWENVWSARNGSPVETATTLEQLEKENEAKPHGLPIKWWEL